MTARVRIALEATRTETTLLRALALALLALGLAGVPAAAVPEAVTSVSCSTSNPGDDDLEVFGPLPFGLTADCDRLGTGYQANSHVQTDFGPGIPLVGIVHATASASSSGILTQASASSGGTVTYYFEIEEEAPSPFSPGAFPIYFEAKGEGSLSGGFDPDTGTSASASFTAIASMAGVEFGLRNVHSSETSFESFEDSTVLDLEPTSPSNPFYRVEVAVGCEASASGLSGTCQAVADPLIRFDQATFDAVHGSSSFELADYYRLGFSENLPVPEPAPALLLVMGALVLLGAGRLRLARDRTHCQAVEDSATWTPPFDGPEHEPDVTLRSCT